MERDNVHASSTTQKTIVPEQRDHKDSEPEEPEESSDDASEDEYVAEEIKPKGKVRWIV